MFQLSTQNIHPGCHAGSKEEAISQLAAALVQAGNVDEGYVSGMLAREQQTSTYLGSGIAIPHGTTETRGLVKKTGVQIFQFPEGVAWGEGQTAYIAIGIAASSDEHLGLLRQLTHVLSDDAVAEQLKTATQVEEIRALLMGETQTAPLLFDNSTVALNVDAQDLVTLQAINAGRLNKAGAVDAAFVSHAVSASPLYLGQGVWLNDSVQGNKSSAIAISRAAQSFELAGKPVSMLVTIAAVDEKPLPVIQRLDVLLSGKHAAKLSTVDASGLLMMLTSDEMPADEALSAEFVIRNEHGLHARPGTVLVNTIKQFDCDVSVINLDGSGKPANGRSLMKVVALGVKKGHRLRFTAQGEQAEAALQAIGEAIAAGLGEGAQ